METYFNNFQYRDLKRTNNYFKTMYNNEHSRTTNFGLYPFYTGTLLYTVGVVSFSLTPPLAFLVQHHFAAFI